jgi:hypothetical protein
MGYAFTPIPPQFYEQLTRNSDRIPYNPVLEPLLQEEMRLLSVRKWDSVRFVIQAIELYRR